MLWFAACLAILVTIAAGYPILGEFRRLKLGKSYSGDEPEAYAAKAGHGDRLRGLAAADRQPAVEPDAGERAHPGAGDAYM